MGPSPGLTPPDPHVSRNGHHDGLAHNIPWHVRALPTLAVVGLLLAELVVLGAITFVIWFISHGGRGSGH